MEAETVQLEDTIALGQVHVYTSGIPKGCAGRRYLPHRFVVSVPTYQRMVLVEALDGPDAGLWFVCSLSNFSLRYRLEEEADFSV